MASLDFTFPTDFGRFFEMDVNSMSERMLKEASDDLVEGMKKVISAKIKGPSTGELVKSIKAKKTSGSSIFVGPTGYSSSHYFYRKRVRRKSQLSNAAKAVFMEYGTSKESPRPFIDETISSYESKIVDKMQETFDRMVGD